MLDCATAARSGALNGRRVEAEEHLHSYVWQMQKMHMMQWKFQREDVWTISVNQHDVLSAVLTTARMFMEIYSGNIVTDRDLCWRNEPPKDHRTDING